MVGLFQKLFKGIGFLMRKQSRTVDTTSAKQK